MAPSSRKVRTETWQARRRARSCRRFRRRDSSNVTLRFSLAAPNAQSLCGLAQGVATALGPHRLARSSMSLATPSASLSLARPYSPVRVSRYGTTVRISGW